MSASEHPHPYTSENTPRSRHERFTKDADPAFMFSQPFVTSIFDERSKGKILSNPLWQYEYIIDWYDGPLSFTVLHPVTNVRLLGVNWDDSLRPTSVSKSLFVQVSEEEFISFRSRQATFRDFYFSGRPLLLVEHLFDSNRIRQSPYSTEQLNKEVGEECYDSEGVLAVAWEIPFWSMYEDEQSHA